MQEGGQTADRNRGLLADLQDELAQVTSAREVIDTTGSLLAAHLDVSFVSLTRVDPDQQAAGLYVMWSDGRMPPVPDRGRLTDYVTGDVVAALRKGETVVCRDAEGDPRTHGDAVGALGLRSWVVVPFRRGGDLLSVFSVADRKAHDWRDDEVELLRDVAVRVLPRLERARAEDALRASEERFRTIVTTANEGISMMGRDGRITFVNDVLAKWLGYGPDELIGRRPAELSAEHDTARVEERAARARRGSRRPLRPSSEEEDRRAGLVPDQRLPDPRRGRWHRGRGRDVHRHRRAQEAGGGARPPGAPARQRPRRHLRARRVVPDHLLERGGGGVVRLDPRGGDRTTQQRPSGGERPGHEVGRRASGAPGRGFLQAARCATGTRTGARSGRKYTRA